MPRPEKVQAVEEIRDRFETSSASFLTEYRGLSVTQLQELRRKLREAGGSYKVYKMTLARRAADELGAEGLDEWLAGPTAIAFAGEDPVPVAKALSDYANNHELFVIKGGLLSGSIIAPETVAKLATIESREVLLAQIAGAAKAPLVNLAGLMSAFTRNAASMFSQLLEKKEGEAVPEDAAEEATPAAEAQEAAEPAEAPAEAIAEPEADAEPDAAQEGDTAEESDAAEAAADEESPEERAADGDADGEEE